MPNFHALSSALTFQSTNVVVIGGTQGIGSGIAVRFAELGASVLVVGRNEALGNEIVKTLEKAAEKNGRVDGRVRFGFARSSVEQIRAAAEDIARWAGDGGGVSAGFLPLTAQSMATGFNVQILSHFLIPYLLLTHPRPVLRKGAQICNIARPGEKNQTIDLDDFRCGKFSILKDIKKFIFMMDLFTHEFNLRFPDTHTTNVHPGTVSTAMMSNPSLPWFVRIFAYVVFPFTASSPAEYADVAVWEIASEEGKGMARTFWDQYGQEIEVDRRVKTDSQLREGVWENLLQLGGVGEEETTK